MLLKCDIFNNLLAFVKYFRYSRSTFLREQRASDSMRVYAFNFALKKSTLTKDFAIPKGRNTPKGNTNGK